MIVPLDIALLLILIATAVLSLLARDLLAAVALLAGYSLFTALLFAGLQAVDVALVEAALGTGVTGVLMVAAILLTTRRAEQRPHPTARKVVPVAVGGFVLLMLAASTGLPDRGVADSPAQTGVSTVYLERSLEDMRTPNVVTAILADYRSADTLGETLVILTAALSAAMILTRRFDRPEMGAGHDADADADGEGRR